MARNGYPVDCEAVLSQYGPLVHTLAQASGLSMDDIRQEVAVAWLAGQDPSAAVPAAVGVRRLGRGWVSQDLHVTARRAENDDAFVVPTGEMPRPKARRGSVAAGVAADLGVGLRAAQKRLKRQRYAAKRGQGDLFMAGGE